MIKNNVAKEESSVNKKKSNNSEITVIRDEYLFPFALFSLFKCKRYVRKLGDVIDDMDTSIGRPVLKIRGSISSNNYIEFPHLHLIGSYIYFQIKLLSNVASIHIDLSMSDNSSLRISLSTIYNNKGPKLVGNDLRLPIPIRFDWIVLVVDIKQIIKTNIPKQIEFSYIRKMQVCSNMTIRDIVTSDKLLGQSEIEIPRQLMTKPLSSKLIWIDVLDHGKLIKSKNINTITNNENVSNINTIKNSEENEDTIDGSFVSTIVMSNNFDKDVKLDITADIKDSTIKLEDLKIEPKPKYKRLSELKASIKTPKDSTNRVISQSNSNKGIDTSNGDRVLLLERILSYHGNSILFLYNGNMIALSSGKNVVLVKVDEPASDLIGFWRAFGRSSNKSDFSSPIGSPKTKDPRLNSFQFNEAILLTSGYNQTFLRGHNNSISLLEMSNNETLMASSESCLNGSLILWNILEGKRLCTLQCHTNSIITIAFSPDCSMMATAGYDVHNRLQIIVWDIQLLLLDKGKSSASPFKSSTATNNSTKIVAKQVSEFDIIKLSFSPYEENSLISTGRENIRFWRIRKLHLPGRPVLLNDYSRGYVFSDIGYYSEPGVNPKEPRRQCVYVASNKGLLLKIDAKKEIVICAYQLHSSAITSFIISHGIAATGGSDFKLRVWSLDFSDYLMEANFEGSVTSIKSNSDGSKLLVGSDAGTIGILTVSQHSYSTILRSHVSSITQVAKRGSGEEFATVSNDKSIRVWDLYTGQQKYEFSSSSDIPNCVCYHPFENVIACGFKSGYLRIFDIVTTTTIYEHRHHKDSIIGVMYVATSSISNINNDLKFMASDSRPLRLITIGLDNEIIIYDVLNGYQQINKLAISNQFNKFDLLYYNTDKYYNYLAISSENVLTLTLIDLSTMTLLIKDGSWTVNPLMQSIMKSTKRKEMKILKNNIESQLVNGLSFVDSIDTKSLLITTSKHAYCIKICCNNKIIDDEEVITKRFEFGESINSFYDNDTNITIIPIKQSNNHSFALLGMSNSLSSKFSSLDYKLSITLAQLYQEQPEQVIYAIVFAQHGKLITVDKAGGILIWNIRLKKLNSLISSRYSPQIEPPINTTNDTTIVSLQTNINYDIELENNDTDLSEKFFTSKVDSNVDINTNVDNLIDQFQNNAEVNPGIWSKGTIDTKLIENSENNVSSYSLQSHDNEMVDDILIDKSTFAVQHHSVNNSVKLEDMFTCESPSNDAIIDQYRRTFNFNENKDDDAAISTQYQSDLDDKDLNISDIAENNIDNEIDIPPIKQSHEIVVVNNESSETLHFGKHTDKPLISAATSFDVQIANVFNHPSFKMIAFNISTIPQYLSNLNQVIVSDGSTIILKDLDINKSDKFLPKPESCPTSRFGSIIKISTSKSNKYIVACIKSNHNPLIRFLVVWGLNSTIIDNEVNNQWNTYGGAELSLPMNVNAELSITWCAIKRDLEYVVICIPMICPDHLIIGSYFTISLVSVQALEDKLIPEELQRNGRLLFIPNIVITSFNGFVSIPCQVYLNNVFSFLAWIDNKIFIIIPDSINNNLSVYWSADIGKKGPIRSVDIIDLSDTISSKCLVVYLDSFGDVYGIYIANGTIQTINIPISGSHLKGNPLTIKLSNELQSNVVTDTFFNKLTANNSKNTSLFSDSFKSKSVNINNYVTQLIVGYETNIRKYKLAIKISNNTAKTNLIGDTYSNRESVIITASLINDITLANKYKFILNINTSDLLLVSPDGSMGTMKLTISTNKLDQSTIRSTITKSNTLKDISKLAIQSFHYKYYPLQLTKVDINNPYRLYSFGFNNHIVAFLGESIKLYNISDCKTKTIHVPLLNDISSIVTVLAGCENLLVVSDKYGDIHMIDINSCQLIKSSNITNAINCIQSIEFINNDEYLLISLLDRSIIILSIYSSQSIVIIPSNDTDIDVKTSNWRIQIISNNLFSYYSNGDIAYLYEISFVNSEISYRLIKSIRFSNVDDNSSYLSINQLYLTYNLENDELDILLFSLSNDNIELYRVYLSMHEYNDVNIELSSEFVTTINDSLVNITYYKTFGLLSFQLNGLVIINLLDLLYLPINQLRSVNGISLLSELSLYNYQTSNLFICSNRLVNYQVAVVNTDRKSDGPISVIITTDSQVIAYKSNISLVR